MKTRTVFWGIIAYGIVGALLLAGTAGAAPPRPGGVPSCEQKLATCNTNLTTCNTDLATCEADLAACEAEPHAVFPGDGAGSGPALSYTDNGNGTVTDNNTLLMWDKKDDNGGIHDKDNTYTWTSDGFGGTAANGTLFTVFLDTLNNKCDGDETTP